MFILALYFGHIPTVKRRSHVPRFPLPYSKLLLFYRFVMKTSGNFFSPNARRQKECQRELIDHRPIQT